MKTYNVGLVGVGAVGTETMSGVSIVNQFIFVFNLLVFGVVSAGSIFSAQFFGVFHSREKILC